MYIIRLFACGSSFSFATYLLMARGLGDASAAMQLARLCRAIAQVQSLAEQLDSEAWTNPMADAMGLKYFTYVYTGWSFFFQYGMNTDT